MVDTMTGGALMRKDRDEAYKLLEEMVSNDYQWQTKKAMLKKVTGMHGPNDIITMDLMISQQLMFNSHH